MQSDSPTTNVIDLAAHRARRSAWQDEEARGRLLLEQLRAEARANIAAGIIR